MKVTVEECPGLEQTEVDIRCPRLDAQLSRLVDLLLLSDARLTGEKDGETCILGFAEKHAFRNKDRRDWKKSASQ